MAVNLTRIYTKLGDTGETHLGDMSRVSKTDLRIATYGTVDELNSQIGVALLASDLPEKIKPWLATVQNDLFDLGADVCVPSDDQRQSHSSKEVKTIRVQPRQTGKLEKICDEVNAELTPLKSFVLPGGCEAAAQLHVCRTVCRRAERHAVAAGELISSEVIRYLNRLSDMLFILSRYTNKVNGVSEPLWQPGSKN